MSIRRYYVFAMPLVTLCLSGCIGDNSGKEVRSAEYEAYCTTCHNLNGSPSFMGPIGVQLGPNTCKKVSCSDLDKLKEYIEVNMPPRSSVCTGECAESTAQFIIANFQAGKLGNSALNANAILSVLDKLSANANITAYDQSTGEIVELTNEIPSDTSLDSAQDSTQ